MKISINKQKPSIFRISMAVGAFLLATLFIFKSYYLWFATYKDYSKFAHCLILIGADVDSRNKDNETPLMVASVWSYHDLVNLFIKSGANLNAQDRFGNSPLFNAVRGNDPEIIRILLRNGADPNISYWRFYYFSPLLLAIGQDRPACAQALIEGRADVNRQNQGGRTPLMSAAQRGRTEIVKLLLSAQAEIDAKDLNGYTALTYAQAYKHKDVVDLLLRNGANSTYKDIYKWEDMD
ncbi:MAG: ankyrin repeat domain-containing protein [Thermodesulfovibrionales bacterium]